VFIARIELPLYTTPVKNWWSARSGAPISLLLRSSVAWVAESFDDLTGKESFDGETTGVDAIMGESCELF